MRSLAEDRRGAAVVELSCMLPVLMLLALGYADVVQLSRGKYRVQSTAAQISQIVSQCTSVSSGDKDELVAMATRMLGSSAASGKPWSMAIVADGVDAQDKPFTWTMQHTQSPGSANSAHDPQNKPDPNRSPLTPKKNEVVYRTLITATAETSFFARHNPVIQNLLGSDRDGRAYGFGLHVSRASDVNGLKAPNEANKGEDCLKAR